MNYRNTEHGKTTLYNRFAFWFITCVIGTLIFLYAWKTQEEGNKVHAEAPKPILVQTAFADTTMEAKVDALKEEILDTLMQCESAGRKEEDGIAILDSNDKGSYGPFQFQRTTVMFYMEKKGEPINGRDAIILALQGDKARDLARYVIFETDAGVAKDWVNCNRKHGLQTQVDLIKKLTN